MASAVATTGLGRIRTGIGSASSSAHAIWFACSPTERSASSP